MPAGIGQFQIVLTSDASGGNKSKFIPCNYYWTPFQVTLRATVSGTVTYSLQYTMDDLRSATWVENSADWTTPAAALNPIAALELTLISPVTAVRLLQTAGTGSVTLRFLQGGGV